MTNIFPQQCQSKETDPKIESCEPALRMTITKKRLNNCMLLHVHKEKVDNLNIILIANEFDSAN